MPEALPPPLPEVLPEVLRDVLPEAPLAVEPVQPFPRFWGAVGLVALYFMFEILAVIPVAALDFFRHTKWMLSPAVLAFAALSAGVGVVASAVPRTGLRFFEFFGKWNVTARILPWVAVCIAANLFLVGGVSGIMLRLWPGAEARLTRLTDSLGAGAAPVAAFFLMVIAAPLSEEAVMRGVILRGLLQNYSRRKAILIGAALFALAHFNPLQFATALILGALLGWWFSELQSIWLGVIAHALNNLIPFLTLVTMKKMEKHTGSHFGWTAEVVALAIGGMLLAWGVRGCGEVFRLRREHQA